MPSTPPRVVCSLCSLDDQYVVTLHGDGTRWLYTCDGPGHKPYNWDRPVASPQSEGREGIIAELGLYDDLLACLDPNEPRWVEHGVVEHRYLTTHPRTYFGELLPRWGHTSDRTARGKSTSLVLAQAMGQLRREELLEYRTWKPTGFWAKNSTISYWTRPPAPPDSERLTWHTHATQLGLDPSNWHFSRPATS